MNYFMIGGDKREYGPVSADLIRQWLQEGRASGDTLLRLENESTWKPLREFPEFQQTPTPQPEVPPDAPPPAPSYAEPMETSVQVGHSFARAWHLVGEHFGVVFAATLLVWLVMTAPIFSCFFGLVTPIVYGPLFGGLFMVFLKLIREGDASPSDLFTLTSGNGISLMITGLFIKLVSTLAAAFCCGLPGIYLWVAWLFALPLVADRGLNFWEGAEQSRRVITRHWFKIAALVLLAFLPVMGFGIYMALRQWVELWPLSNRMFETVMASAGGAFNWTGVEKILLEMQEVQRGYLSWVLMKQVLLLISLPIGVGSLAFVYEDIFGRKRKTD